MEQSLETVIELVVCFMLINPIKNAGLKIVSILTNPKTRKVVLKYHFPHLYKLLHKK